MQFLSTFLSIHSVISWIRKERKKERKKGRKEGRKQPSHILDLCTLCSVKNAIFYLSLRTDSFANSPGNVTKW
jgi:hypothetical protein